MKEVIEKIVDSIECYKVTESCKQVNFGRFAAPASKAEYEIHINEEKIVISLYTLHDMFPTLEDNFVDLVDELSDNCITIVVLLDGDDVGEVYAVLNDINETNVTFNLVNTTKMDTIKTLEVEVQ
jgi:hypothetical protein